MDRVWGFHAIIRPFQDSCKLAKDAQRFDSDLVLLPKSSRRSAGSRCHVEGRHTELVCFPLPSPAPREGDQTGGAGSKAAPWGVFLPQANPDPGGSEQ